MGAYSLVDTAIGKNEQASYPAFTGEGSSLTEFVERALETGFAFTGAKQRGQRCRQQIPVRNAAQLFQFAIAEQRMLELQHVAVFGRFFEDVVLAADVADQ